MSQRDHMTRRDRVKRFGRAYAIAASSDEAMKHAPRWYRRQHHKAAGMLNFGIKKGRRQFRTLDRVRDWLDELRRRQRAPLKASSVRG